MCTGEEEFLSFLQLISESKGNLRELLEEGNNGLSFLNKAISRGYLQATRKILTIVNLESFNEDELISNEFIKENDVKVDQLI